MPSTSILFSLKCEYLHPNRSADRFGYHFRRKSKLVNAKLYVYLLSCKDEAQRRELSPQECV